MGFGWEAIGFISQTKPLSSSYFPLGELYFHARFNVSKHKFENYALRQIKEKSII